MLLSQSAFVRPVDLHDRAVLDDDLHHSKPQPAKRIADSRKLLFAQLALANRFPAGRFQFFFFHDSTKHWFLVGQAFLPAIRVIKSASSILVQIIEGRQECLSHVD